MSIDYKRGSLEQFIDNCLNNMKYITCISVLEKITAKYHNKYKTITRCALALDSVISITQVV